MTTRTALVMAGGTGGHIFPGLAVAELLQQHVEENNGHCVVSQGLADLCQFHGCRSATCCLDPANQGLHLFGNQLRQLGIGQVACGIEAAGKGNLDGGRWARYVSRAR